MMDQDRKNTSLFHAEEIVKLPTQPEKIGESGGHLEEFQDVLTGDEVDITGPFITVEDEPLMMLGSDPNTIKEYFSNDLDRQHSADKKPVPAERRTWDPGITHGDILKQHLEDKGGLQIPKGHPPVATASLFNEKWRLLITLQAPLFKEKKGVRFSALCHWKRRNLLFNFQSIQTVHLHLLPLINMHLLQVIHRHLWYYNLQVYVKAQPTIIEDNHFVPVANVPFVNVFAPESSSEASSSEDAYSEESTHVAQPHHHLRK
ncbi:hypothetical protein Tco_1437171 [Tanacetum coccineum]